MVYRSNDRFNKKTPTPVLTPPIRICYCAVRFGAVPNIDHYGEDQSGLDVPILCSRFSQNRPVAATAGDSTVGVLAGAHGGRPRA